MRVSWRWLCEWVDLKGVSPQEGAQALTQLGMEVEAIEDLSRGWEKVVVGKILSLKAHPKADRLQCCQVTDGKQTFPVVCGARNMKSGDLVALAQIGADLPNGMKIQKAKLRGEVSEGMLCSGEELGLESRSDGILILSSFEKMEPGIQVGTPLIQVFGRDDTVFDLSIAPNRGDLLGHIGIARELAGFFKKKLRSFLKPYSDLGSFPLKIVLQAQEQAPAFCGAYLKGIDSQAQTPLWVQNRLRSLGFRSLGPVVDATNWVLLEWGHPVHAYDAQKWVGSQLGVRFAKEKEKLLLLDGKELSLSNQDLVIAQGEDLQIPIALAGVMGGETTGVSRDTQEVFLEVAYFDPVCIRRTSLQYRYRTESAMRFEKGADPHALVPVATALAHYVQKWTGARLEAFCLKSISDNRVSSKEIKTSQNKIRASQKKITVSKSYFESFLGMCLDQVDLKDLFMRLGCEVKEQDACFKEKDCGNRVEEKVYEITPASYRPDLVGRQDLAEELARVVGYDCLQVQMPPLRTEPASLEKSALFQHAKHQFFKVTKEALVRLGFFETLSFSLTSKAWLKRLGIDAKAAVSVQNPLSQEHEILLPSLLPALLETVRKQNAHCFGMEVPRLRLFELRPVFKGVAATKRGDPFYTGIEEKYGLSLCLSGPIFESGLDRERPNVDFFNGKGVLEALFSFLGFGLVKWKAVEKSSSWPWKELFHPGQVGIVIAFGKEVGAFGRLRPDLEKFLKAKAPIFLAELDWDRVFQMRSSWWNQQKFCAWMSEPPIERDFAFLVPKMLEVADVLRRISQLGKGLIQSVRVFDCYEGSQVEVGKRSLGVRVVFRKVGEVLKEKEAEAVTRRIIFVLEKDLKVTLRNL